MLLQNINLSLGLRDGQSSEQDITVNDIVKNATETVKELAEGGKTWATQLGIRYQTLHRQLEVSLHPSLLF